MLKHHTTANLTLTFCVYFRGAEYVSAREWMRICFELLELLKAHKKAIRRATVNTFGYIAKAIGWVPTVISPLVTLRLPLCSVFWYAYLIVILIWGISSKQVAPNMFKLFPNDFGVCLTIFSSQATWCLGHFAE